MDLIEKYIDKRYKDAKSVIVTISFDDKDYLKK